MYFYLVHNKEPFVDEFLLIHVCASPVWYSLSWFSNLLSAADAGQWCIDIKNFCTFHL